MAIHYRDGDGVLREAVSLGGSARFHIDGQGFKLDAFQVSEFSLFGMAADSASLLCCNHNHVSKETHLGEVLWVHRKGAISARDGEPGIIPGSMGTASFHVCGRGHADALCSSSHGAGRCLSALK